MGKSFAAKEGIGKQMGPTIAIIRHRLLTKIVNNEDLALSIIDSHRRRPKAMESAHGKQAPCVQNQTERQSDNVQSG